MELTALALNEPIQCPKCRGAKTIEHPSATSAREYWSGCNPGSFRRRDYPADITCPTCNGTGTVVFTVVSERLQGILDGVAKGGIVEANQAPTTLAGDDWTYILAHPQIVRRKLGFSSDYWLYHTQSEAARRARSFY